MFRGLVLAALALGTPRADTLQALGVLRIKVVVEDDARHATAVPRHLLLISDNPSSAPPRRLFTSLDGSLEVRLPPGNYTIESDRPFAFEGKAYQWTQLVDIVAGRDTVLELTAGNAEVETLMAASSTTPGAAAPLEADPESRLLRWLDSVVAIWSPTTRASGVMIDTNGLIVTSQRVVGTATSVEVQLTPTVKVAANVLAADPARDVAVLRIDPGVVTSARPLPLGCGVAAPPLADGQEIFAIEAPLRRQKGTSSGIVIGLSPVVVSDLMPAFGGAGGPVFTAGGAVIGVSSPGDEDADQRRLTTRVVRVEDVCHVVAAAQAKIKDAAPEKATLLPVEPAKAFPVDVLKELVRRRAGSLNPYEITSTDFVIAFMTPLHIYATQGRFQAMGGRGSSGGSLPAGATPSGAVADFGNWSEYVADVPPVLLIRATPKLVEGFWTKVARGAASTQGVALPPFKRPKTGFARMRAFCGDTEITPIHPLKVEHRVSGTETMYEGLYVFDPGALAPTCGSVKLQLYSEKEPAKAVTQILDAKLVEQIWSDFSPYRAQ